MKTDKTRVYVWLAVLVADIILLSIALSGGITFDIFQLIFVFSALFITAVPVRISESSSRFKNWFGYGIPIALLLPVIYFVYDYYTCTGKFCQLGDMISGGLFCIGAALFALFYTFGLYARRWREAFALSVLVVELVLLVWVGSRIISASTM
ncbi:MAG: hypothetical protein RLZZ26_13 [Candidatus Parcubacteria bacterium]|jgi:hypothetical protein